MTPSAKDEIADVINMVAFCSRLDLEGSKYEGPWMRPVGREVLLNEFQDWNNEITGLLKVYMLSHLLQLIDEHCLARP